MAFNDLIVKIETEQFVKSMFDKSKKKKEKKKSERRRDYISIKQSN